MTEVQEVSLSAEEVVTRFVYDSQSALKGAHVRPSTFLPMFEEDLQRWETSVCRTALCSYERLLGLGRTQRTDSSLKAFANVAVLIASQNGLACIEWPVDGFAEHAVLLGWPTEKEQQKLIAMALAKASNRTVVPA